MKTVACIRTMSIGLLMLIALATASFAQEPRELVAQADKAFLSGNGDAAKALYLKAAAMGSADAHYWLATRYPLTREEKISHYSEAAKGGQVGALTAALDMLLFRAHSLTEADPQKALDLYDEVKKANPQLNAGYYEEEGVRVMKMCVEPERFDARRFMKKYGVKEQEEDPDLSFGDEYYVWRLAEEASTGGRFGKPDPELVFNLVMRGGFAPAELIPAIEETYKNWKKGIAKKFDLCKYVTSGYGQKYCAAREMGENDEEEDARFTELRAKLGKNSRKLLDKAYSSSRILRREGKV